MRRMGVFCAAVAVAVAVLLPSLPLTPRVADGSVPGTSRALRASCTRVTSRQECRPPEIPAWMRPFFTPMASALSWEAER